jgi:hypothetical protein
MTDGQGWGQPPQYPPQDYGQQYPRGQSWQPQQYDPRRHQQQAYGQPQQYPEAPPDPWGASGDYPQQQAVRQPAQRYQPPDQPQQQPRPTVQAVRKTGLTAAESFWYVMGCIPFGAMYFAKIPSKKALADFGMAELTAAESFWYILMCIPFGAGYFAKIPTAKAISELPQFRTAARPQLEYRR